MQPHQVALEQYHSLENCAASGPLLKTVQARRTPSRPAGPLVSSCKEPDACMMVMTTVSCAKGTWWPGCDPAPPPSHHTPVQSSHGDRDRCGPLLTKGGPAPAPAECALSPPREAEGAWELLGGSLGEPDGLFPGGDSDLPFLEQNTLPGSAAAGLLRSPLCAHQVMPLGFLTLTQQMALPALHEAPQRFPTEVHRGPRQRAQPHAGLRPCFSALGSRSQSSPAH